MLVTECVVRKVSFERRLNFICCWLQKFQCSCCNTQTRTQKKHKQQTKAQALRIRQGDTAGREGAKAWQSQSPLVRFCLYSMTAVPMATPNTKANAEPQTAAKSVTSDTFDSLSCNVTCTICWRNICVSCFKKQKKHNSFLASPSQPLTLLGCIWTTRAPSLRPHPPYPYPYPTSLKIIHIEK